MQWYEAVFKNAEKLKCGFRKSQYTRECVILKDLITTFYVIKERGLNKYSFVCYDINGDTIMSMGSVALKTVLSQINYTFDPKVFDQNVR